MFKLGKNEKVLLEVRKHWFILFSETLFLVFLLFLPAVIALGVNILNISKLITIPGDNTSLFIVLTAAWFLFVWIIFFVTWTNYYLDILVITNRRIIDMDQKSLFSRDVATSMLEHVEDITTEIHGLIPTLLGFGDIHLQTAAESREFTIKGIPSPADVRRKIMKAQEDAVEGMSSK